MFQNFQNFLCFYDALTNFVIRLAVLTCFCFFLKINGKNAAEKVGKYAVSKERAQKIYKNLQNVQQYSTV